jgi:multiple sugar transport system substrate-binding protein
MDLCRFHGHVWGLPLTPATAALHYNRRLFREAGLDPDRPPRTLQELDQYARQLTKYDEEGRITQLGFSPALPDWWIHEWMIWFGGKFWDGVDTITAKTPESIRMLEWVESYPREYGRENLQRVKDQAISFDSAQYPFFSERLAMILQGVWMHNFIDRYNPDMDWAAAPFPAADPSRQNVTFVNCDIIVIPRGCKNIRGAWDFIRFTQQQENIELLNLGQRKFSPLRRISREFHDNHPNPHIRLFRSLAESENAHVHPGLSIWTEYDTWMRTAFEKTWFGLETPANALQLTQDYMQESLDRSRRQWKRVETGRLAVWKEWSRQAAEAIDDPG